MNTMTDGRPEFYLLEIKMCVDDINTYKMQEKKICFEKYFGGVKAAVVRSGSVSLSPVRNYNTRS